MRAAVKKESIRQAGKIMLKFFEMANQDRRVPEKVFDMGGEPPGASPSLGEVAQKMKSTASKTLKRKAELEQSGPVKRTKTEPLKRTEPVKRTEPAQKTESAKKTEPARRTQGGKTIPGATTLKKNVFKEESVQARKPISKKSEYEVEIKCIHCKKKNCVTIEI